MGLCPWILFISGIFVRIKGITDPGSILGPTDILAQSISPSFWALEASVGDYLTMILVVIHRFLLLLGFLRVPHYHILPYCLSSRAHLIPCILFKVTFTQGGRIVLTLKSDQPYIAGDLKQADYSSIQCLIYKMGTIQSFWNGRYVGITWKAYEKGKQSAGPSREFLIQ